VGEAHQVDHLPAIARQDRGGRREAERFGFVAAVPFARRVIRSNCVLAEQGAQLR
jgi:hypothetical protein